MKFSAFLMILYLCIFLTATIMYIIISIKKKNNHLIVSKLHSYLVISYAILFLIGFFFTSSNSRYLTEKIIPGKWVYGEQYVTEDRQTGEPYLTGEIKFVPKDKSNNKFVKYIEYFASFLWILPGIFFYFEEKRNSSVKNNS